MREPSQSRQHARKIFAVASLDGEASALAMHDEIVASCQRCLKEGQLDPLRTHDLSVIEGPQLNERRARFEGLLRLAEPMLMDLANTLEGSDCAVMLTDYRGVILDYIVEQGMEHEFRRAGLRPGSDWQESQLGTRERLDLGDIVRKVIEAENSTGRELRITGEAMSLLLGHPWPGNLRQLRYVIRTAIALCDGDTIDAADINLPAIEVAAAGTPDRPEGGTSVAAAQPAAGAQANALSSAEHQVILASLHHNGWNISRTAEALGMSRNTLYCKMRRHGIAAEPH